MNWKGTVLVAGAVFIGFIGGIAFHRDGEREATTIEEPTPAEVVIPAVVPVAEPSTEIEQQVKALQKELEAMRRKSAMLATNLQSIPAPARRSTAERSDRFAAFLEANRVAAEQRDNDKLLAAGFTLERIKWLRHRGEERYSMALQAIYERQHKGLPLNSQIYLFDEDLDLVKDIGEAEYDRYRQASGRPLSATINSVQAGSFAEGSGLKAGDEVIRYDGNRVYNIDQLEAFASETKSEVRVSVEVRRSGQIVQVTLPGGPIGVGGASMSQIKLREIEAALPESLRNSMRQALPQSPVPGVVQP